MSAWCACARPLASLHVLAVVYGMNLLNCATRGSLVRRGCALARSSEGAARQDAIENKPRNSYPRWGADTVRWQWDCGTGTGAISSRDSDD